MSEINVGFVGGGNMTRAIAGGLLASGLEAAAIRIAEPSRNSATRCSGSCQASRSPLTTARWHGTAAAWCWPSNRKRSLQCVANSPTRPKRRDHWSFRLRPAFAARILTAGSVVILLLFELCRISPLCCDGAFPACI